jgi:hypothetical protein
MNITFITSLYKSERYLKKYLKNASDLAETLLKNGFDFEFIIISNDQSEAEKNILIPYSNIPWLRMIKVERETLYASWNRGIKEAKFPVCTFWNVDDIRFPEATIDGLKLIETGKELVYFPFTYKRYIKIFKLRLLVKKLLITPPQFNKQIFTSGMNCGPFFMFTKTLYKKVGPFDESFKIAGDFDWCVRAAQITDFSLSEKNAGIFINEGTSLSGSKNKVQQDENDKIYKKYI